MVAYSFGKDDGIEEQMEVCSKQMVEYVNIIPKDSSGHYEVRFQTRDGNLYSCNSGDILRGRSIDAPCVNLLALEILLQISGVTLLIKTKEEILSKLSFD